MARQYTTFQLVASMVGLVAVQPLMWFLLAPLSSMSNLTVYWLSYGLWTAFGLVSGIKSTNPHKDGAFASLFAISLMALLFLSKYFTVIDNVAYSFSGFWSGLGLGAGLYLVKPSLNRLEPDKHEARLRRAHNHDRKELSAMPGEEKIITAIFGVKVLTTIRSKEISGLFAPSYNLYFTNRRVAGILSRSDHLEHVVKEHSGETQSNALDILVQANLKHNFSVSYDQIQSMKLHRYSFWATYTGKVLSLKFGGITRRYLLTSETYQDLKGESFRDPESVAEVNRF